MEEKNKEEHLPIEIQYIIHAILMGYLRSKL